VAAPKNNAGFHKEMAAALVIGRKRVLKKTV